MSSGILTDGREVFDNDSTVRKSLGSKGGQVFRGNDNPNEVFVLLGWDSLENWHKFAASQQGLKEKMMEAGVVGNPEMWVLEGADNPSA